MDLVSEAGGASSARASKKLKSIRSFSSSSPDGYGLPLFDTLSAELLVEIFIRLDLEPVHRCQCVSKRWRLLISEHDFRRAYVRHRIANPSLPFNGRAAIYFQNDSALKIYCISPIFRSDNFSLSFLPSSDSDTAKPIRFVASSNGLILCCATEYFQRLYYVCNPLTGRWTALPPPPSCVQRVRIGILCKSPSYDQSGVDSTSFRVVRILHEETASFYSKTIHMEIFSSEDGGGWSDYVTYLSVGSVFDYRHYAAVAHNGKLYWNDLITGGPGLLVFDPYVNNSGKRQCLDPSVNNSGKRQRFDPLLKNSGKQHPYQIVSKNSSQPSLWTVRLPKDSRFTADICFAECSGRLRYAEFHHFLLKISVWELRNHDCEGDWSMVHDVHLSEFAAGDQKIEELHASILEPFNRGKRVPLSEWMNMVAMHPIDLDVVYLRHYTNRLVKYDLRCRTSKAIYLMRSCGYFPPHRAFPFVLPPWPVQLPLLQQGNVVD